MSSYAEFLEEKNKIDKLCAKGYTITGVRENLSGAFVVFERPTADLKHAASKVELHILTADARKYFSNIIIGNRTNLQTPSN